MSKKERKKAAKKAKKARKNLLLASQTAHQEDSSSTSIRPSSSESNTSKQLSDLSSIAHESSYSRAGDAESQNETVDQSYGDGENLDTTASYHDPDDTYDPEDQTDLSDFP